MEHVFYLGKLTEFISQTVYIFTLFYIDCKGKSAEHINN